MHAAQTWPGFLNRPNAAVFLYAGPMAHGEQVPAVFVRRYTLAAHTTLTQLTHMQWLRWETEPLPGMRGQQVQSCDGVTAAEPAYTIVDATPPTN